MVLKRKVNGAWIYLDNVTYASVYLVDKNADGLPVPYGTEKMVDITRGDETVSIYLNDIAYLLNDNGKTIDRIV